MTDNSLITTKQSELQLFDEFRRLLPEVTLTRIVQPKPPAPDILADFCGNKIGIEITRHIYEQDKQREKEEDIIVKMASDQYRNSKNPTVGVSLSWIHHLQHSLNDRKIISEALFSVIAQNIPPLGGRCELDASSLPELLAASVNHVQIDRLIDYTESDWRIPRAAWVRDVKSEDIWRAIKKKESHWNGYRQYCDAVWLIITSEGLGPSSWCEIPDSIGQEKFKTLFQRIFFIGSNPKKIIELSVIH